MQTPILPYTSVFIKLLKGPIEYVEVGAWEKLIQYKTELIGFLSQLGLLLVLDENDGYAYITHAHQEDEEIGVSWMQRRALSYEESTLLVLLREMMSEFELSEATQRELIKKRREIKEYIELFYKQNASRVKLLKEIDRLINRIEELGFLQLVEDNEKVDEQRFRIRKIIKAKVGSDFLEEFYNQLLQISQQRSETNEEA